MTIQDIATLRLSNQQISAGRFTTPKKLAEWMGAMQAQDFRMVKWAIGLRLPGCTADIVEKAIDDGDIIRTHVLRPTWHFVDVEDLGWMLDLSAPGIMASLKSRQNFLGLTPQILSRSNEILAEALKGKKAGRDEIAGWIRAGGIALKSGGDTGENRLSHILLWAELSKIICSGGSRGNNQAYALISDRVPEPKNPGKEEALRILACKYFRSHGPATIKDFAWWSGLSTREIRAALERAGDELESASIDSVTYWFGKDRAAAQDGGSAWLLPAFDEFIISYTDRSAVMSEVSHKKAVSQNGVFRSVLVVGNHVEGLWKPEKSNKGIIIKLSLFRSLKKAEKIAVEEAAESYGNFLGEKAEVKYE